MPHHPEPRSLEPSRRLYDASFLLAIASQMCFVVANTLMAHYSRWIEFLGGGLEQVGAITGYAAIFGLLLRPWMAQWINRLGAKRMWACGYLVFSGGAIANIWLTELDPAIYAIRAAILLGAAMVFASGLTYVSQIAPPGRRTEAIGILGIGGFVGMLVGPSLGDLFLGPVANGPSIASSIGRQRSDFVWLFSIAAVANLLPLSLIRFIRSPETAVHPAPIRIRDFVTTVIKFWPGSILLIDFVFGICMTAPFVFVASFIDQVDLRIGEVSVIGVFFWFYAGTAILLRIGLRRLPERLGARKVLVAGIVLMGLGMFAFAMVSAERAWLIAFPAILAGAGHSLAFHTMTSLTIEPFPSEYRGTASALALMMLDLGTLVGGPILGRIGETSGFGALFATIGACCLGSAAVYTVKEFREL